MQKSYNIYQSPISNVNTISDPDEDYGSTISNGVNGVSHLNGKPRNGVHKKGLPSRKAASFQPAVKGHWLPDRKTMLSWVREKAKQAKTKKPRISAQSLNYFRDYVTGNETLSKLSNAMFSEVPDCDPYKTDPVGGSPIEDFEHLLTTMSQVMAEGPQFYDGAGKPDTAMGLLGFPVNAVLDWPMGTRSGYFFFLDPGVNKCFEAILKEWNGYLRSDESQKCLVGPTGWLCPTALKLMEDVGNVGTTGLRFDELFQCDPTKEDYGFGTWDKFFTREFVEGRRLIDGQDDPRVIVNSCESEPLQYVTNVQHLDTFWLKEQPYSLSNMLNQSAYVSEFVGGSVYQAFLSALSYHRWHAPVSGKILAIDHVPGTYYSENLYEGFADPDGEPDPSASNLSQSYLSAVATRGIIYIDADNKDIGLMAIVYIGMAEVSSCDFEVVPGQHITKGQKIGTFRFGGSSHCMIFRPQTKIVLKQQTSTGGNNAVNSELAKVMPTDRWSSPRYGRK